MINYLIGIVLVVLVALAVRSIWKTHRKGGCGCGCEGCGAHCHSEKK